MNKLGITNFDLQIHIENDGVGKHASCISLPQLYGYGNTEQEAVSMLKREMLSLREEVKNSQNVAEEYRQAVNMIDAVWQANFGLLATRYSLP